MTLYDTLGVDKGASAADIKKAFREGAKKKHEDKGGDNEEMVELNKAYAILSNPAKRKRYDNTGETSEESFEVKFAGLIQQVFMGLVEREENVEGMDLVKRFGDITNGILAENNKNKRTVERKVEKIKKVYDRLSEGRIKIVVGNNLEDEKRALELVKENIEFLKKCKEVIASEHYRFEEVDLPQVDWIQFRTA